MSLTSNITRFSWSAQVISITKALAAVSIERPTEDLQYSHQSTRDAYDIIRIEQLNNSIENEGYIKL